jgi:hypothetical protein
MHVVVACTVKWSYCRRVLPGQTVALLERLRPQKRPCASQKPADVSVASQLAVAFEDDHMACIVKPQGIPTQASTSVSLLIVEAWIANIGRVKVAQCLRPVQPACPTLRLQSIVPLHDWSSYACLAPTPSRCAPAGAGPPAGCPQPPAVQPGSQHRSQRPGTAPPRTPPGPADRRAATGGQDARCRGGAVQHVRGQVGLAYMQLLS